MSGNHAGRLSGEDATINCEFEQIEIEEKIEDKQEKITIYKKADSSKTQYIAFAGKEKKLKVFVKREPISCSNKEGHNSIEVLDIYGKTDKVSLSSESEIVVKYPISDSELLEYIWGKDTDFKKQTFTFKSCKGNRLLTIKTYPDIKWAVVFSFGIDNPIGIRWKELNRHGVTYAPPKAHETAGKVGADTRWGRGTTFEFGFSSKRDDDSNTVELKAKLETRIEALNNILNALKEPTDILLKKLGGKFPAQFETIPPSLSLEAQWQLCRNEEANQIGKIIELAFKSDPIIGLKGTLDLLGLGIYGMNPGAYIVYKKIKEFLDYEGIFGTLKLDIFVDLIFTGEIKGDIGISFNTLPVPVGKKKVSEFEANLDAIISMGLKAGVRVEGEVYIAIIQLYTEAEASISGNAGVLFGLKLVNDNEGLYLVPKIEFEGLKVIAILKIKVGVSNRKTRTSSSKYSMECNKELKFKADIIKPFDLIEAIGFDPKVRLIKNNKK